MIMAAPLPRMLWQKEHTRFPLTDLDAGREWEGGFHLFQTSHLNHIPVLTRTILYESLYISTGGKLSPANQLWLDYTVPWRISTIALVPLTPSYRNEWFLSSVHSAISLRPHLSSARFSCPSSPGKATKAHPLSCSLLTATKRASPATSKRHCKSIKPIISPLFCQPPSHSPNNLVKQKHFLSAFLNASGLLDCLCEEWHENYYS